MSDSEGMDASQNSKLRFDVGARVECMHDGEWKLGIVLAQEYNPPHFADRAVKVVPYLVQLDGGDIFLYIPADIDQHIRPPVREEPREPAREALARLLAEPSSGGGAGGATYCFGKTWEALPPKICTATTGELTFPLGEQQAASFIAEAKRSGVGTKTETVINLEARKSWELLPKDLTFLNADEWDSNVISPMLDEISTQLGLSGWQLGASLYKMLLYEEGCYFRRHKDNVRIDDMWGTLVIQLPSVYSGAALSVYSPSALDDVTTFDYSTVKAGGPSRRSARQMSAAASSSSSGSGVPLKWAAFYADCQHEVDTLTSGHRCVLVYNLTGVPADGTNLKKRGLNDFEWRAAPFKLSTTPPQPADETLIAKIAHELRHYTEETKADYPSLVSWQQRYSTSSSGFQRWKSDANDKTTPSVHELVESQGSSGGGQSRHDAYMAAREARESMLTKEWEALPVEVHAEWDAKYHAANWRLETVEHGKPEKLVAVLNHFYTPQGLNGLHSLKGRDRVVAELLVAATRCTRDVTKHQSLGALAAQALVKEDPSDYQGLEKHAGAMHVLQEALKPDGPGSGSSDDGAPAVDAFLSLVVLWDSGECTPNPSSFTFGPLIPLVPGTTVPPDLAAATGLSLGRLDERGVHQLFNGEGIRFEDDYDDEDEDYQEVNNWWSIGPVEATKRSIPICADELLLSNAKLRKEIHKGEIGGGSSLEVPDGPTAVEFLGNGCPYPGQCYSRAAIIFWPTKERSKVIASSPQGAVNQGV